MRNWLVGRPLGDLLRVLQLRLTARSAARPGMTHPAGVVPWTQDLWKRAATRPRRLPRDVVRRNLALGRRWLERGEDALQETMFAVVKHLSAP
jgi:hypothetical protein